MQATSVQQPLSMVPRVTVTDSNLYKQATSVQQPLSMHGPKGDRYRQ